MMRQLIQRGKNKRRRLSLEQWLKQVDVAVQVKIGLGKDDLPDCDYAGWYDEGCSPATAAARAIKSAQGY